MILVRHGQSEWNAVYNRTRVDPGIPDAPLTDEGQRQALRAAEVLADHGIRRLMASPYKRTVQTALIIAEHLRLPVQIEPRVRERAAFSCDVGTHRSRLAATWPHLDFAHLDEMWWPPAEESEAELAVRCDSFRTMIRSQEDWPYVAVVSHWGFIRGLAGIEARNGQLIRYDPIRHVGSDSDIAAMPCADGLRRP